MLFGFVVLHHGRRQLVHVGVTAHPTAEWLSHQISTAFPWDRARLAILFEIMTAPLARSSSSGCTPWGSGIDQRHRDRPGRTPTLRRNCLDHLIIVYERNLRSLMCDYTEYYNRLRTHSSLGKDTPLSLPVQKYGALCRLPHFGGLRHLFVRM